MPAGGGSGPSSGAVGSGPSARCRRLVGPAVALVAVALTAFPIALDGWPTDVRGQVGAWCTVVGAALIGAWRQRFALVAGPALLLVPVFFGPTVPTVAIVVLLGYAALIAERWGGRAAWVAGIAAAGYLALIYVVSGDDSPGLLVLTVPGYLAGTALRLRRETAEALAERGRELDAERERYTEVSVRNERARIARELHDIVGHALSVMVVQAAAGQRLVDRTPDAAQAALDAIAAAARQGRADLQQLIRLLGGDGWPRRTSGSSTRSSGGRAQRARGFLSDRRERRCRRGRRARRIPGGAGEPDQRPAARAGLGRAGAAAPRSRRAHGAGRERAAAGRAAPRPGRHRTRAGRAAGAGARGRWLLRRGPHAGGRLAGGGPDRPVARP